MPRRNYPRGKNGKPRKKGMPSQITKDNQQGPVDELPIYNPKPHDREPQQAPKQKSKAPLEQSPVVIRSNIPPAGGGARLPRSQRFVD